MPGNRAPLPTFSAALGFWDYGGGQVWTEVDMRLGNDQKCEQFRGHLRTWSVRTPRNILGFFVSGISVSLLLN